MRALIRFTDEMPGRRITLAGVAVPAIVRMADLGLDIQERDMPRVERWYDAIRAQAAPRPTMISARW